MSSPDVPPQAIIAMSGAVASYEPEAVAAIAGSPSALLSVLLEASRRGLEAAAPHLAAAERERCAQLADKVGASYLGSPDAEIGEVSLILLFADLLREQP